jgi:hypothetical protein
MCPWRLQNEMLGGERIELPDMAYGERPLS